MFASPSPSVPRTRTSAARSFWSASPPAGTPERQIDLAAHHRQPASDEPWNWLGRAKRCDATGPNLDDVVAGEVGHVTLHATNALPINYARIRTRARVRVLRRGVRAGGPPLSEAEAAFDEGGAHAVPLAYGPVREAGDFLLAITLEGGHIQGSPFALRVRPARAHAAASELVGSDDGGPHGARVSSAAAGRDTFFLVLLRDAYGNRLETGGARVAVRFDVRIASLDADADPDAARVRCAVTDERDGSYAVQYAATVAGSYDATVALDGAPLGGGPMHCVVLPGPTFHAAATLELAAAHSAREPHVDAGEPLALYAVSRDLLGNRARASSGAWRVELRPVCATGESGMAAEPPDAVRARVRDEGDGTYLAVALPTRAGEYTAHLLDADGAEALGSPLRVRVGAGALDARASRTYGAALDGSSLVCGEPSQVFVEPADAHGNALARGAAADARGAELIAQLRVELTDADGRPDERARVYARAHGGRLVCEVVATRAGDALVHVALGGAPVHGSPFGARATAGPADARACVLRHARWRALAGDEQVWALHAHDRFGNACARGGAAIEILLTRAEEADGPHAPAEARTKVVDRRDGTYALHWRVERAGVWSVRVSLGGVDMPGAAPARVLVEPAAASARGVAVEEGTRLAGATLRAGEWVAFLLVARDAFGNATLRGGDELAAACSGSAEPVLMHDWGDGRYELRFVPTELGAQSIAVALPAAGGDVVGSPFRFLVAPGPAAAATSSASGAALDGAPLCEGIGRFAIVARDALGHRRGVGGDAFAVTVVPRSHSHYGHVHRFDDAGDGTYDVEFTTALSGKYHVAVMLGGVHIMGSPFPVVTSAAAPSHLPRSPLSPRAAHRPGSPPWPMRTPPRARRGGGAHGEPAAPFHGDGVGGRRSPPGRAPPDSRFASPLKRESGGELPWQSP